MHKLALILPVGLYSTLYKQHPCFKFAYSLSIYLSFYLSIFTFLSIYLSEEASWVNLKNFNFNCRLWNATLNLTTKKILRNNRELYFPSQGFVKISVLFGFCRMWADWYVLYVTTLNIYKQFINYTIGEGGSYIVLVYLINFPLFISLFIFIFTISS